MIIRIISVILGVAFLYAGYLTMHANPNGLTIAFCATGAALALYNKTISEELIKASEERRRGRIKKFFYRP